jgi:AraC family transcriptional regulator
MHRVLEHVDRHLDDSLELDTLAAVANFSPFHFHRLFSAWMGETLGDYVRRRRLELAALRLVSQPAASVLHVAVSVGFGSAEAFARAFKMRFSLSPSAWRARERALRKLDQTDSNPDQEATGAPPYPEASHHFATEASMNVTLTDREPTNVAYFRHVGPYGPPIDEFWRSVVAPWMRTNGLIGQTRFGISHDDPNITAPDKCRYDACVEVPPDFSGSGKYLSTVIPGGRYACSRYSGSAAKIGDAWASLLRDWLPESGLQLDARPFFEHYGSDSGFDPKTGVFSCDLCIPVTPL